MPLSFFSFLFPPAASEQTLKGKGRGASGCRKGAAGQPCPGPPTGPSLLPSQERAAAGLEVWTRPREVTCPLPPAFSQPSCHLSLVIPCCLKIRGGRGQRAWRSPAPPQVPAHFLAVVPCSLSSSCRFTAVSPRDREFPERRNGSFWFTGLGRRKERGGSQLTPCPSACCCRHLPWKFWCPDLSPHMFTHTCLCTHSGEHTHVHAHTHMLVHTHPHTDSDEHTHKHARPQAHTDAPAWRRSPFLRTSGLWRGQQVSLHLGNDPEARAHCARPSPEEEEGKSVASPLGSLSSRTEVRSHLSCWAPSSEKLTGRRPS